MKIKVAILDNDKMYLDRISMSFATKYPDEIQIYSFTDKKTALDALEKNKIEVFLSVDDYEIDVKKLPKRCGFAYFVEKSDINSIRDEAAIGKFQKIDLIYQQILNLYSEKAVSISAIRVNNEKCKVYLFISPSGGVGTSTVAAASAKALARTGKKVFYLNLECFGAADMFFRGDGQFDLSDVIYAVKSKKSNLALKIESCTKRDENGICFFSQPKTALDLLEMTDDDKKQLISLLQTSGKYDDIIIDMGFEFGDFMMNLLQNVTKVIMVSDGSELSNEKTLRLVNAFASIEDTSDYKIIENIRLFYNKFSKDTGKILQGEIKMIDGAPKYKNATSEQIVEELSRMDALRGLDNAI